MSAVWSFGACERPPQAVPPDFQLEYMEGAVQAEQSGHTFIRILPPAKDTLVYRVVRGVRYYFVSKQDGKLRRQDVRTATGGICRDDALLIYRAVVRNGFWRLRAQYGDAEAQEGAYRRLTVTAEGREKTVMMVNTTGRGFRRIVAVLEERTDPKKNPDIHVKLEFPKVR